MKLIHLLIKLLEFSVPKVHPVRPNPKTNSVSNRGDTGKIEELTNQIVELKVSSHV